MEFEERKAIYKQLLIDMSDQAAELLASGKAIEIDRSRSGLKLYSFRRRHEVVQKKAPRKRGDSCEL